MRRFMYGSLVVLLLTSATIAQESGLKTLQQMQGKWKVVRAERNGQTFPSEFSDAMSVVIDAGTMTIKDAKRTEVARIEIDDSQSPIAITMRPIEKDGMKEMPAEGIIAIEGTTMRLCWAKKGKARPTEFLTRPMSDTVYLLLEREGK